MDDAMMKRQLELETEMLHTGAERFRAQLNQAKAQGNESALGGGFRLLQRAIEPTAVAIRTWMEQAKEGRPGPKATAAVTLDGLDPFVLAFITARTVLDGLTTPRSFSSVASAVGSACEDEARFRLFEELEGKKFDMTQAHLKHTKHKRHRRSVMVFQANAAGVAWAAWSNNTKLHCGTRLLELFMEATGLVSLTRHGRGSYRLEADPKVIEWLEEANSRHAMLSPSLLPCVVPPKPWTTPFDGGYWSKAIRRRPLVKAHSSGYLEELANVEMPDVYATVNALQNTAWSISPAVLDVAKALWDSNLGAGVVLPSRDGIEQPRKPDWLADNTNVKTLDPDKREAFIAWKRASAQAHAETAKLKSRRLQTARLLSMADRFVGEKAIWFPHNLDFRGRLYAMVPFLSPQGGDLSRGLLRFAEGKPINDAVAAGWLAIHGANCFGVDKVGLEDRITWVAENEDAILAVDLDPIGTTFWRDADKPWQFLAFCFEWAAFQRMGYGFVSHLPVSLDGSCNGIQHFSAMLRDEVGGSAVNLTPNDTPSDIYQMVADRVVERLVADGSKDALRWVSFGINRKTTKRSVMVLPYGGTFVSCRDYVQQAVEEAVKEGTANPWDGDPLAFQTAVQFLSSLVWASISDVVVGARSAMAWLRQVTNIAAKRGLPINWITPSGFPVQQAYREMKERKVKTRLGDSVVYLTLLQTTPKLDAHRQVSGISPNFVHSLDASALCASVVCALNNGVQAFAMVHDAYGTHAADTEVLSQCLRHAFVQMYQEHDVLTEFQDVVQPLVGDKPLPPPPHKGSLDIEQVLSSDYFFA